MRSGDNDNHFGDVVSCVRNSKKGINGDDIQNLETSEPIGQKWMFGTLSEYLVGSAGIVIWG